MYYASWILNKKIVINNDQKAQKISNRSQSDDTIEKFRDHFFVFCKLKYCYKKYLKNLKFSESEIFESDS